MPSAAIGDVEEPAVLTNANETKKRWGEKSKSGMIYEVKEIIKSSSQHKMVWKRFMHVIALY
jgi:hypothetical protein